MGVLMDKLNLSLLVNGNGIVDNFKNNSLFFYESYQKSTEFIENIAISDIYPGNFYFLHYYDDSNWMKYSPVFVVDYKKFEDKVILMAVNFNFIPIEIRVKLFDKFIIQEDIENERALKVDFTGMYSELLKVGFEYSLVEYNSAQIKFVHKISLNILPRFLYHQHPINKYDPNKLMSIWEAKLSGREQRHKEIMLMTLDEMYNIETDITEKYQQMSGHIKRIQKSIQKYG
tara:strand:- start:3902 stop:4591 length:690 start_codon:yes stop_codon:yes gene_type:complete